MFQEFPRSDTVVTENPCWDGWVMYIVLCQARRGVAVPSGKFSYEKTAYMIRSMLVRSENTPMGLILLRTSTKPRSIALVVLNLIPH